MQLHLWPRDGNDAIVSLITVSN